MRLTNTDIDAALRDMAKRDGYDAKKLLHTDRLLRHDTAPCEQEQAEVEVEYVPESAWERDYFSACVACICIVGGIGVALWARLTA